MVSLSAFFDCVSSGWSPRIGDPSVMGWVTVAVYGVSAVLCVAAYCRHPHPTLRIFGFGLAVLLTILMVNKQLDLQSALTAAGRCLSKLQGWYQDRRVFQYHFIQGLLLVSVIAGIAVFWAMRSHLAEIWLALLGLVALLTFIAIRAVGFHHFDAVINISIHDVRMNWVLELGGLAMISANAIWLIVWRGPS